MGSTAERASTLSWDGKVADNPKPFGITTPGKGPLTEEDLADFEKRMLKLVNEMAETISQQKASPARNDPEA